MLHCATIAPTVVIVIAAMIAQIVISVMAVLNVLVSVSNMAKCI